MGSKARTKSVRRTNVGRVLVAPPRPTHKILECGGRARCAEELTALLQLSLDVLAVAADKAAACDLLATPARMRRPAGVRRVREMLDHLDL